MPTIIGCFSAPLDPPRKVGRGEGDEGEPDEEKREVARPDGRVPDRDVSRLAVLAVADPDQDEAEEGEERVGDLVAVLAQTPDQRRAGLAGHGEAVGADEEEGAEKEGGHGPRRHSAA
jgi:hypothetical protein